MDRRLTRAPYLGAILVLSGLQAALAAGVFGMAPAFIPGPDYVAFGVMLAIQVVKIVPTAWRLNDLGRSLDDVIWGLIPFGNFVLFQRCVSEGTPSKKRRKKALARRKGQVGALAAFGGGGRLLLQTAPAVLPFTLLYGLVSGLGSWWFIRRLDWFRQLDDPSVLTSGLWFVTGFLGIYTAIQFAKRRTVSRESWFPVIFLVPLCLLTGVFYWAANSTGQLGQIGAVLLMFLYMSWSLLWLSIGGAAAAIGWIHAADKAARGESADFSEVFGVIASRLRDVAVPHAVRVHAVTIGIQVVIPGIFYALQLALVDMVATLQPDRRALRESASLTWGIRGRLFKLFVIWLAISQAGAAAATALIQGPTDFYMSFFDPRVLSLQTIVASEVVWGFTTWWLTLALLLVFYERTSRKNRRDFKDGLPVDTTWLTPNETPEMYIRVSEDEAEAAEAEAAEA